jgi:hypothetical protein
VEVAGQRFRVRPPQCATHWLPETSRTRPLTIVGFRRLREAHDRPCCTLQALAPLVGRPHRQAARQPLEDFRQGGEDVRAFVWRKRKGAAPVVAAVVAAWLHTPLAGPTAVVPRGQARVDRHARSVAHLESALEQSAWVPVLRVRRRQLETGQVPYHEAWRWTEWLERLPRAAPPRASWSMPPGDRGLRLADPPALAALVPPRRPLAPGPDSLCGLTFLMTLFYGNVPLSVLGRWGGVHKTTRCRWVLGLALALWPLIPRWSGAHVKAAMVDVDETWLKRRGRWH